MANHYTKEAPEAMVGKKGPSKNVLQSILDFSRSVEVQETKDEPVLVHLN